MEQVYAYIRINTSLEIENGYAINLKKQKEVIEHYCKKNKLKLNTIFEDKIINDGFYDYGMNSSEDIEEMVSDGLIKLIKNIKSGIVKKVIILNTYILFKDVYAESYIKGIFLDNSVDLISVEQDYFKIKHEKPSDGLVSDIRIAIEKFIRGDYEKRIIK